MWSSLKCYLNSILHLWLRVLGIYIFFNPCLSSLLVTAELSRNKTFKNVIHDTMKFCNRNDTNFYPPAGVRLFQEIYSAQSTSHVPLLYEALKQSWLSLLCIWVLCCFSVCCTTSSENLSPWITFILSHYKEEGRRKSC